MILRDLTALKIFSLDQLESANLETVQTRFRNDLEMNRNPPQILDESDDDFDPKTEDIHQYGEIIGLDPKTEGDLLWIAKEGILAKLQVTTEY